MPRIVCISDTHLAHRERGGRQLLRAHIPDGDILVHAGDLTLGGSFGQILAELKWICSLPHRYKVVIAGNHDRLFQTMPEMARTAVLQAQQEVHGESNELLYYLQDSEVHLMGLNFYGSPWTPRFYDWAFQLDGDQAHEDTWQRIHDGAVDVLITHGPPRGILDLLPRGERVGDNILAEHLANLADPPRLHIFGHIHTHGGNVHVGKQTVSVNAAICDEVYSPTHRPVVIDI